jgi:hypothetical protein
MPFRRPSGTIGGRLGTTVASAVLAIAAIAIFALS